MATKKEVGELLIKLNVADAESGIKSLDKKIGQLSTSMDALGKGNPTERRKLIQSLQEAESEILKLRESVKTEMRVIINGEVAGKTLKELKTAQTQLIREMKAFGDETDPAFKNKEIQLKAISQRIIDLDAPITQAKKGFQLLGEEGSLVVLKAQAAALEKELERLSPATTSFIQKAQELDKVRREIDKVAAASQRMRGEFTEIGESGSLTHLKAKADALRVELERLAPGTQKFISTADQLKGVNTKMDGLTRSISGNSSTWDKLSGSVKMAAASVFAFLGAGSLINAYQRAIEKTKELADMNANVAKTTGLSALQIGALNASLAQLNTRTSQAELLNLAAEAGKLGKTSRKDVLEFVKAADQINVALGEDLGADGIKNIGKINDLFRATTALGVEKSMLAAGSAVNSLGQAGTANEGYIVDFTKSIAGIAVQSDISLPKILGLGATLDELGLANEVASTSLTQVFIEMQKNSEQYAKIANVDVKEFAKVLKTDANEAFVLFLEGLNKNNSGLGELSKRFDELGIDGKRGIQVISALTQNTEKLREKQELANNTYKEATSITQEFQTKNQNFAGDMEKVGKVITNFLTSDALTSGFQSLIHNLADLVDTRSEFDKMGESFKTLGASTKNLEQNVVPLLSRYDELKSKSTLNAQEQAELEKIIAQVANTIPLAISQVDQYGKALGINTDHAREYIKAQQELTKFKNSDAIREGEKQLKQYADNIRAMSTNLNDVLKTGTTVVYNGATQTYERVRATNEDVNILKNSLITLNEKAEGTRLLLRELQGLPLVEVTNPTTTATLTKEAEAMAINAQSAEQYTQKLTLLKAALQGATQGSDDFKRIQGELSTTTEQFRLFKDSDGEADLKKVKEFETKMQGLLDEMQQLRIDSIQDADLKEIAQLNQKYSQERNIILSAEKEFLSSGDFNQAQKTAYKKAADEQLLLLEEKYQREKSALVSSLSEELREKEFNQDVANLQQWGAQQKLIYTEQFASGAISQEKFNSKMQDLEDKTLQYKLQIAKDYGKSTLEIEQMILDGKIKINEQDINNYISRETERYQLLLGLTQEGSQERMDLEIAQIEKERDAKLVLYKDDAAMRLLIEQDANQQIALLRAQHLDSMVQQSIGYFNQWQGVMSTLFSKWDANEQAELTRDKKRNAEKKKNLDKQLKDKLISQEDYNAALEQMDQAQDAKERRLKKEQFQRQRTADVIQSITNTALSVSRAYSQYPGPPATIPLAIFAGVLGAVQTGIIASTPVPQFAMGKNIGSVTKSGGGIPAGPSHSQGGIKLVNSLTGKIEGEMEGREPIIPVKVAEKYPQVINALLDQADHIIYVDGHASGNNDGRALVNRDNFFLNGRALVNGPGIDFTRIAAPQFLETTLSRIDVSSILEAIRIDRFGFTAASGQNGITTAQKQQQEQLITYQLQLMATLKKVDDTLHKVETAYSDPKHITASFNRRVLTEVDALDAQARNLRRLN